MLVGLAKKQEECSVTFQKATAVEFFLGEGWFFACGISCCCCLVIARPILGGFCTRIC